MPGKYPADTIKPHQYWQQQHSLQQTRSQHSKLSVALSRGKFITRKIAAGR
jgi:protocatechuate 3,4-dioxygenase beta subunit